MLLDIEGAIVSIDAMRCQTEIAEKIIANDGDYLLVLKGNQSSLHKFVVSAFSDIKNSPLDWVNL